MPSECISLFSAAGLFHLAHVQKAEGLSPEMEVPETFYVPKYGFLFQGRMEYDLLFGSMKVDLSCVFMFWVLLVKGESTEMKLLSL